MRIGPINLAWGKSPQFSVSEVRSILQEYGDIKSWAELNSIINRQQSKYVQLKTNPKQQLAEYKSWVFDCINLIHNRVSIVPFGFYNSVTNEKLTPKNRSYKSFSKIFYKPNDFMNFRTLISFCQAQAELCGMSIMFKVRNGLGQIWELLPLDMADYTGYDIVGNKNQPSNVIYKFRFDNAEMSFGIDELLIYRHVNPLNVWEGMSPIKAQAYAIDIDTYIEVYERDFFKNSARVDFALTTDLPLNQEKADEIKQRWLSKYRGTFHDVAVLDSGLKPIPLKYTNKDFQFLELSSWSKQKILSAFRISESKLGGKDETNRAGSVYVDINFNRECIQPRLSIWDDLFTEVVQTYDEKLNFRYDNPIPRDRQLDAQEAKTYVGAPINTINEWRKSKNLPEISGGDDILIPSGYVYLSDLKKITENSLNGNNNGDDERDRTGETHVNPDGTDDRDDNPTDGRIIDPSIAYMKMFFSDEGFFISKNKFINQIKSILSETIISKDNTEKNLNEFFNILIFSYVSQTLKTFGCSVNEVDTPEIISIASKLSIEYNQTLLKTYSDEMDWKTHVVDSVYKNDRISKLISSCSSFIINYTKFVYFTINKIKYNWNINSNICGHFDKVNFDNESNCFKIGTIKMKFPSEIINFNCDCTLCERIS